MINLSAGADKGYPVSFEITQPSKNKFVVTAFMVASGVPLQDSWHMTRPQMGDLVDLMREVLQVETQ